MGIEFCNRMGKSNSIWPSHIFEKQQQNSRRYRSEPLTVQDPGKEHGYRPLCFQAQNGKNDHHTLFKILEICARTEADQFIILDEKNASRPKLNKKLTCYKPSLLGNENTGRKYQRGRSRLLWSFRERGLCLVLQRRVELMTPKSFFQFCVPVMSLLLPLPKAPSSGRMSEATTGKTRDGLC